MIDPTVLGAGIADRIVGIGAAMARQQSFVVAPGEAEGGESPEDDALSVAEHLVLRALQTGADHINHRLLEQLCDEDTSVTVLSQRLGLSPSITWERVNDLVQCGLVGRSTEQDLIGLSASGSEFVRLVSATMSAAALAAAAAISDRSTDGRQ